MTGNDYLENILQKYQARDLSPYQVSIANLKSSLIRWGKDCGITILDSGSRAKGTATSLSSDVDYFLSLSSSCNQNSGGLRSIFESLYQKLDSEYGSVRKQNVSVRIKLGALEVDITPARKYPGYTNLHWVYLSKQDTIQWTNIQKHISDIGNSGRHREIMILKIWRDINGLDFPSIYLEYLLTTSVLLNKPKGRDYLAGNIEHIFSSLSAEQNNPLNALVVDPSNSKNRLSDLISNEGKRVLITAAKNAHASSNWEDVFAGISF